jgi:hypothetical protein
LRSRYKYCLAGLSLGFVAAVVMAFPVLVMGQLFLKADHAAGKLVAAASWGVVAFFAGFPAAVGYGMGRRRESDAPPAAAEPDGGQAVLRMIAAALVLLAAPAAGASHTVQVRVSNRLAVYSQALKISAGEQANFAGPASGGRSMIFNAVLGAAELQYQLEVSGGRGSEAPMIQVQGALRIRPGRGIVAAECGPWTVELSLDRPGGPGGRKAAAAWDDGGLGNYRLTADIDRGSARQRCSVAVAPGSQANVVDGFSRGGKRYGFIFNVLPAEAGPGKVGLQYQLEYTPAGMTSLQLQNQETLTLGRESRTSGRGYTLGILAQAGASSAVPAAAPAALPSAKPAAPAPRAAEPESKAVPLLR